MSTTRKPRRAAVTPAPVAAPVVVASPEVEHAVETDTRPEGVFALVNGRRLGPFDGVFAAYAAGVAAL